MIGKPLPEWDLTVPQAAVRAGCTKTTIRKMLDTGELTVVSGNPTRISAAQLDAALRARMASHGPECPKSLNPFPNRTAGDKAACECVVCHCGPLYVPRDNGLQECARCFRPLIVDGRVWRPSRKEAAA